MSFLGFMYFDIHLTAQETRSGIPWFWRVSTVSSEKMAGVQSPVSKKWHFFALLLGVSFPAGGAPGRASHSSLMWHGLNAQNYQAKCSNPVALKAGCEQSQV